MIYIAIVGTILIAQTYSIGRSDIMVLSDKPEVFRNVFKHIFNKECNININLEIFFNSIQFCFGNSENSFLSFT